MARSGPGDTGGAGVVPGTDYKEGDPEPKRPSQQRGAGGQSNEGSYSGSSGGSSSWSRAYHSKWGLRKNYYMDASGQITPVEIRTQQWRTAFVQQGDADLQNVLDYTLNGGGRGGIGPSPFERKRGLGDVEMDIAKRRKTSEQTISFWLEFMRKAKPDELNKYQQILYDAGYMDPDVYKKPALLMHGVYDEYTQDAWQHLLKDAVMSGDTRIEATLNRRRSAIDAMGGLNAYIGNQQEERAPFVADLTAAEDIIGTGETVAKQMTGRRQEGFAEDLVGGYNAKEEQTQRQAYDLVPTGGTATEAPSIQGYAESRLRQQAAPEVGAYAGLGAFNQILQDLGLGG
jgi:hypothetical protein